MLIDTMASAYGYGDLEGLMALQIGGDKHDAAATSTLEGGSNAPEPR